MKIDEKNIIEKIEDRLRACLERVPFLEIDSMERRLNLGDELIDIVVDVRVAKQRQRLALEVKNNGQPRVARTAAYRLARVLENCPGLYGVFAAPYISPRTAEICVQEKIGYLDLAGNCRLTFSQIYIEQGGKPNPFGEKRDLRSLYSPKAARVLRVILNNPRKNWKMKDLAREAEVSLGQAANVKKLLDGRELIEKTEEGFTLREPFSLLSEWSRNYVFRKNRTRDFYSLKTIPDIEAEITEVCEENEIAYALTGFSGAARYMPTVRYQRVMAFVDVEEDRLSKLFEFKEVGSGANVTLLMPYDAGVYYGVTTKEGSRVVSPVQLYLDLMGFRGRGEEAANAVLEEVIKPLW